MALPPKLDLQRTLGALDALLGQDRDPAQSPAARERLHALVRDMARDGHRRSDPIREVFARLGDRWSVLLLLLLRASDFRHATLRRLVGTVAAEGEISQRMLTLRLRSLESDGLISSVVAEGAAPAGANRMQGVSAAFETALGQALAQLVRQVQPPAAAATP